jgi:DNA-binding transcriptional LysR family regulator
MADPRSDRFVRSHLKIRHLVLLVELARHGSVIHAAEAANLTQPAASKLLGELEHALGVQLFERLPRGVAPTEFGRVMMRRAGAALAEMDAGYQEVMELLSGMSGSISIGTVLTPSAVLVPVAINRLKQRHARLHVAVTVDTSKVLVERLRSGELDLVIGRVLDSALASELSFEPITDEPHSLIVRAGHPLLKAKKLALAGLEQQGWVLPPYGSILRDRLTALFLSQALEPPAETVESSSLPVIANLLVGSDMLAPLPEELVQPYVQSGMLAVLPFDLGLRMDLYGIITRRNHQFSPGVQAMLDELRAVANERYGLPQAHTKTI